MVALHVIPDWTVSFLAYMTRGELPADGTLARQITRRAKSMTIVNGELHHCSVSEAFLLKKAVKFYARSTKETVVITPVQNPWLLKLSVMASIG